MTKKLKNKKIIKSVDVVNKKPRTTLMKKKYKFYEKIRKVNVFLKNIETKMREKFEIAKKEDKTQEDLDKMEEFQKEIDENLNLKNKVEMDIFSYSVQRGFGGKKTRNKRKKEKMVKKRNHQQRLKRKN